MCACFKWENFAPKIRLNTSDILEMSDEFRRIFVVLIFSIFKISMNYIFIIIMYKYKRNFGLNLC